MWLQKSDIIFNMGGSFDGLKPEFIFESKYRATMLNIEEWTRGPGNPLQSRGSSVVQLGPGSSEAGSSVHGQSVGRRLSISLEKYVTVFQAAVYPILACTYEIQTKDRQEKCVSIRSDSQMALKAPQTDKTTSLLVPKCQKVLRDIPIHHS